MEDITSLIKTYFLCLKFHLFENNVIAVMTTVTNNQLDFFKKIIIWYVVRITSAQM